MKLRGEGLEIELYENSINSILFIYEDEMRQFIEKLFKDGFEIEGRRIKDLFRSEDIVFFKMQNFKGLKVKEILNSYFFLGSKELKEFAFKKLESILDEFYEKINNEERKLVDFILSLITSKKLLIILDAENLLNEKLIKLIIESKNFRTIFIISKDAEKIEEISDYIYIIKKMKVIDFGKPLYLLQKIPKMIFLVRYKATKVEDFIEALERKRGIKIIHRDETTMKILAEKVEDSLRRIFLSAEQSNTILLDISVVFPKLKDLIDYFEGRGEWVQ